MLPAIAMRAMGRKCSRSQSSLYDQSKIRAMPHFHEMNRMNRGQPPDVCGGQETDNGGQRFTDLTLRLVSINQEVEPTSGQKNTDKRPRRRKMYELLDEPGLVGTAGIEETPRRRDFGRGCPYKGRPMRIADCTQSKKASQSQISLFVLVPADDLGVADQFILTIEIFERPFHRSHGKVAHDDHAL